MLPHHMHWYLCRSEPWKESSLANTRLHPVLLSLLYHPPLVNPLQLR